MVKQLVFCRVLLTLLLEDAEATHQIMGALVRVRRDTLVPMRQFLEESYGHLECDIVRTVEDSGDEWEAHPPLSHDSVGGLHLALNWQPLVGSDGTTCEAPKLLDLPHAHQLVHSLCILRIVAIAHLDALDGILA